MRQICISMALVALMATPAMADKRKAAVHLKQGAAYYNAQQYDDAIAEFKRSYELDSKPQTLFNIANAYFKKGDYRSAIDFFQKYLEVDPDGRFAEQALEFSAIAKKALAEEEARRKAAAAAEAQELEKRRIAADEEQKRIAATGHVRNAQAFGQAGAWSRAGDEYRAAFDASGDPVHLLDAADAYRKQPALEKARDTYQTYLAKVPLGADSDRARTRLAEVTTELDKQEAEQAVQVRATQPRIEATLVGPPKTSKLFAQLSLFVPMRGLRGPSELSGASAEGHFSVESAMGFDVASYYAFGGVHAVGASFTYVKLTLFDDGRAMPVDNVGALRAGIGYRLLSRRGRTVRPTIGLQLSYYTITAEDPALTSNKESRAGVEPELGLVIQARDNYLLQVFARLDLVPIFGTGIFLGGFGVGAGAHF